MILKDISEAQAELSALIEAVQKGEEVILSKAGKPIARLTKYQGLASHRKLGMPRSQIQVYGDLKDPMPAAIVTAFGLSE